MLVITYVYRVSKYIPIFNAEQAYTDPDFLKNNRPQAHINPVLKVLVSYSLLNMIWY